MEINTNKTADKLTVAVSGRVDTTTAPELEKVIGENLTGVENLVFDMKDMSYISSAGLGVLLVAQKKMNLQGQMKLINVNDYVMEIFEVTGFSDILTIA